jgi:hypothetical protein
MTSVTLAGSVVGLLVGLIAVLGFLWRLFSVVAELKAKDKELEYNIELLELTTNGVKERAEHLSTRLTNQLQDLSSTVYDLENWTVKNTSYEKRNRRN